MQVLPQSLLVLSLPLSLSPCFLVPSLALGIASAAPSLQVSFYVGTYFIKKNNYLTVYLFFIVECVPLTHEYEKKYDMDARTSFDRSDRGKGAVC